MNRGATTAARACRADLCRQGHAPCPCPQACRADGGMPIERWRLAAADHDGDTPTTTGRMALGLLAHLAFTAACVGAVCLLVALGGNSL